MADSSSKDPPDCGETNVQEDIVAKNDGSWYFSKEDIEENSPSRGDGIDLKIENDLRMFYSTFLQYMRPILEIPQEEVATAIVFCHRFFHRQSHAKNDWKTVAIGCLFLATKVEDDRRQIEDVICASYEVTRRMKRFPIPRMNEEVFGLEVSSEQINLTLEAEGLVLRTIGCDLQVDQPYEELYKAAVLCVVAVSAKTSCSMCNILAERFLKLQLEIDGVQDWWQKFNVTKFQIKSFCDQVLQMYEEEEEAKRISRGTQLLPIEDSGTDEERAARKLRIEKAREIRVSLLSDKNYVPLIPLKHRGDEEANRLYDQQNAIWENHERKLAIIEEQNQGYFTEINPERGQSSKKTAKVQEQQNELPHNVVGNVHTGQAPPHGEDLDKVNKSEVKQLDNVNSSDSSPEKSVE